MHPASLVHWLPAQIAGMVLASLLAVAVLAAIFLIVRAAVSPALEPAPARVALRQLYMRGEIPRQEYLSLIAGFSTRTTEPKARRGGSET